MGILALATHVFLGTVAGVVAIVAFVALMKSSREKTLFRFALLGIICAITGIVLYAGASFILEFALPQPAVLGPNESIWQSVDTGAALSFGSMLLGMMSSYFNRLINDRRAKLEARRSAGDNTKPPLDFDGWDFVQPFFVSLITFSFIVTRIHEADLLNDILIGFQTGFFWQTILSYKSKTFQAGT
jgi:hypothetical protein